MIGFAISIFCLKLSQKDASKELTYGWHRSEIIGTLVSIIFLVTVTMYLLSEAIQRVLTPPKDFDVEPMLVTAVAGLFFNLIQMQILHQGEGHYHLGGDDHDHGEEGHGEEEGDHGHSHSHAAADEGNINVSAAYCHALSDMIMSIGVIISAVTIYFGGKYEGIEDEKDPKFNQYKFLIADPICTFVFSVIVCVTVVPITKKCIHILMEGAPAKEKVNIETLVAEIKKCDPEMEMHDLHVWSITQSKVAMSCHIKTKKNTQQVLKEVSQVCKEKFKIGHSTIQIEDANSAEHQFECSQTTHKKLDLLSKVHDDEM